jgi:hypothetical protein
LELAVGERLDAGAVRPAATRAPVGAMAKASQFALGRGAVSERAARLEAGCGVLELGHRAVGLPGLGECAAGEGPCERGLDGQRHRRELAALRLGDPEVVLADAGYWHQRQIEALVGDGMQVLVPPDAGLRRGAPPRLDRRPL